MRKKILSALLAALCLLIAMSAVPAVSPQTSVPAADKAKTPAPVQTPTPGKYGESGKTGNPGQPGLPGILSILPAISVTAEAAEPQYTDFDDLNGKTIGMVTGAAFEELVKSKAPGIKEILYFSSAPDMLAALKAGKIDAYFMNNAVGTLLANMDSAVAIFPKSLGDTTYGLAFKKNSKDRAVWQEAFDKIPQEDIEKIWEKWTGSDEAAKTLPEQDWPGSNGTVQAACCDTLPPMSYRGDGNQIMGFDIEIILRIAEQLDVHVEFTGMEFSSVMPSVESGKALLGCGSIVVSDERKEVVDFIDYYPASFILMVRSAAAAEADEGLIARLKGSFHRTFIKDSRYKMVLSGLWTTTVIAAFSGFFGLLLAFALVFLRHRNNPVFNRLIAVYCSLISGIPAVVILMVLYYIVFGKTSIPAIIVAVIGFSLIFGARAFGVIWNTLESIDPGQREAALALGYGEEHAFREIILPQARRGFIPLIAAQFTSLVKETSIAGYITVVELTRAGDLIRSRTMEAFFPLLSIALIYFVLIRCLEKAEDLLKKYGARKREERKIKGVDA